MDILLLIIFGAKSINSFPFTSFTILNHASLIVLGNIAPAIAAPIEATESVSPPIFAAKRGGNHNYKFYTAH